MACTFDDGIGYGINARFEDIQLRLGGHLLHTSGSISAKREIQGKFVYVIVFDAVRFSDTYIIISEFIYNGLQKNLRNIKK